MLHSLFPTNKRKTLNDLQFTTIDLQPKLPAHELAKNIVNVFSGRKGGRIKDVPVTVPMTESLPSTTFDSPVGPILGALASAVIPALGSFIVSKLFDKDEKNDKTALRQLDDMMEFVDEIVEEEDIDEDEDKLSESSKNILKRILGKGIVEI